MNTFYCMTADDNQLSNDGVGILLAMANYLMRYHQHKVTLVRDREGFMVVVTTQFTPRTIGVVSGYEFQALIREDGKTVRMNYLVQQAGPTPRERADSRWVERALIKRVLLENVFNN